jgi:hypothetical protein
MRKFLVSSIILMAVIALPMYAQAGHHGHAGADGFRGHHGFRGHNGFRGDHHFRRQPFFAWDTGIGWMDPEEVVVIPQFAVASPVAAPPADPKFVFPPTPSSPRPDGLHTVIVQRGSQIEVQSFPTTR